MLHTGRLLCENGQISTWFRRGIDQQLRRPREHADDLQGQCPAQRTLKPMSFLEHLPLFVV